MILYRRKGMLYVQLQNDQSWPRLVILLPRHNLSWLRLVMLQSAKALYRPTECFFLLWHTLSWPRLVILRLWHTLSWHRIGNICTILLFAPDIRGGVWQRFFSFRETTQPPFFTQKVKNKLFRLHHCIALFDNYAIIYPNI